MSTSGLNVLFNVHWISGAIVPTQKKKETVVEETVREQTLWSDHIRQWRKVWEGMAVIDTNEYPYETAKEVERNRGAENLVSLKVE